jgi:hypothetical protein
LTLATVNPSLQPPEARYVLGQSRAAGVFLVPEVRGNPLAAHAEAIRAELPELRHVLRLDLLDEADRRHRRTQRHPAGGRRYGVKFARRQQHGSCYAIFRDHRDFARRLHSIDQTMAERPPQSLRGALADYPRYRRRQPRCLPGESRL